MSTITRHSSLIVEIGDTPAFKFQYTRSSSEPTHNCKLFTVFADSPGGLVHGTEIFMTLASLFGNRNTWRLGTRL